MKIFLNKNTHVGTDEPADKTKTWLPQNLTEEANFLSDPATYGVLSEPRVKIAESLDAQDIDAYGEKFRVYEVEPSTLVIKEHKNGAWVNMVLNLDIFKSLITFTVDGTSYQAKDGMTWNEWGASTYDKNNMWDGYFFNGKFLCKSGTTTFEQGTYLIVDGQTYNTRNNASGGAD